MPEEKRVIAIELKKRAQRYRSLAEASYHTEVSVLATKMAMELEGRAAELHREIVDEALHRQDDALRHQREPALEPAELAT